VGSQPKGISASRGAAVLGLSPYQSTFEVWQRICEERRPGFNAERGYTPPEEPDNAAIRWGSAFEDAIVELASAKQGKPIGDREGTYSVGPSGETYNTENGLDYSNDERFITCHIDGRYDPNLLIGPVGWHLHEGKTTSMMNFWDSWGEPGTDRIPQGYQVQVQQQMLCTGASEAIVSVLVFPRRPDEWETEGWHVIGPLVGNIPFELQRWQDEKCVGCASIWDWARVIAEMGMFQQYPVHAKPELQAEMVERYRHFWHTYVLPEAEPPIDCYPDMVRAFPAPVGTIVLTEQEAAWITERKMITEEIGAGGMMARRKDELKVITLQSLRSRIRDAVLDDQSEDKLILVDASGKKVGQYNKGVLR
jgi:hypothetical protein